MTSPRPLIAGNWKMHGLEGTLDQARALAAQLAARAPAVRVALCPPATLIARMADLLAGSAIEVGAQDCHPLAAGAYTGEVSAEMLLDAGARLVIVGHSERRQYCGEDDETVAAKALAASRAGLEAIICVGEQLEDRRSGQALPVVTRQVFGSIPEALAGAAFALAYEPVWAIGTGLTPTIAEIEDVHGAIRALLVERFGARGETVPILYGGSVKPANAAQILQAREVGGALVGGASLNADEFGAIIASL